MWVRHGCVAQYQYTTSHRELNMSGPNTDLMTAIVFMHDPRAQPAAVHM